MIVSPINKFLFYVILAVLAGRASAATSTKINGVIYQPGEQPKTASPTATDSPLAIKRIFLFPAVDDVDGVLSPKLDQKLADLFSKNTRFDLVRDKEVIKALSPDDSGYSRAARNKEVHKEAARLSRADTTAILFSKNIGGSAELTLEFRDSGGDLLYSESTKVPGYSPMEARWVAIEKIFTAVVKKIPFEGAVTGRTANTLTIDLGLGSIKQGEELEIARVVSVQRHPLLRTVIGTDYVRVGRAKVTRVDRALSFAVVLEEFPGENISTGNKILSLARTSGPMLSVPTEQEVSVRERVGTEEKKKDEDPFEGRLKGDFDKTRARYGLVGINLQYGSLSHTRTDTTTVDAAGSGLGGNLQAELWITKFWILQVDYGFQNAAISSAGSEAGDATWNRKEGLIGYRFYPSGMSAGTALTGSFGYQSMSFTLPVSAVASLGSRKYTGLAVRADGTIEFLPNQTITAGFGFQPITSVTESGASFGTPNGGNIIGFRFAWNYMFAEQLWLRIGFQFDSASVSYVNSASISEKRFSLGPGIHYSF